MKRLAILAALLLAACNDTKVVTSVTYAEPAPPSADLLAPLVPATVAGTKSSAEAIEKLAVGVKVRDDMLAGWRQWYADLLKSIRGINDRDAAKKP